MNRITPRVAALVGVDVLLFLISGVPRFKDAKHGTDLVIGDVVWIGFLLGLLALIVLGVRAVVRRLTHQEKIS